MQTYEDREHIVPVRVPICASLCAAALFVGVSVSLGKQGRPVTTV
jgi:hypothetical protein